MSNIATILREAEAKIAEVMGVPVLLSMALLPENNLRSLPYEWLRPDVADSSDNKLLMQVVCEEFEINKHRLIGPDRGSHAAKARQAYLFLGQKLLRLSYGEMAIHIRRDRTTALNQLTRAKGFVEVDDVLASRIKSIENKFLNLKKQNNEQS